jgi:hypothetical protein
MSVDPKRIVEEEGDSALAAMLQAARDDGFTQEAVDRVRASLATTLIVASAGAAAAAVKPTGLLATLSAKVGLALALIGAASGAAWLALRNAAPVAAPSAAPRVETTATSPPPTALASASNPPPDPPVDSATARQEQAIASPPVATHAPHLGQPTRVRPETPTSPPVPAVSPPSATPANEGALLLEARRALENDPARAQELVREHEKQFPNSQLAHERARIEAEATKRSLR